MKKEKISPINPPEYNEAIRLPTHIPIRVATHLAPPVYYPERSPKTEEDDCCYLCCLKYKL